MDTSTPSKFPYEKLDFLTVVKFGRRRISIGTSEGRIRRGHEIQVQNRNTTIARGVCDFITFQLHMLTFSLSAMTL